LVKAYAALLKRKADVFWSRCANARTRRRRMACERPHGATVAREVVVALGRGPTWCLVASDIPSRLAIKRGYHRIWRRAAMPSQSSRSRFGSRLSAGADEPRHSSDHRVEFARRDAPPTPIQLRRALPQAHALFPLGDAIDAKPWMGARPCLPEYAAGDRKGTPACRAVVRFRTPAPRPDAWPRTGRLLAEMMTGETPFADRGPLRCSVLVDPMCMKAQEADWPIRWLASYRLS